MKKANTAAEGIIHPPAVVFLPEIKNMLIQPRIIARITIIPLHFQPIMCYNNLGTYGKIIRRF